MDRPNVLVIMTDEERYPPPYEPDAVTSFRREQLPVRESLREGGLEFHRHYAGSTACLPSRATLVHRAVPLARTGPARRTAWPSGPPTPP